MRSHPLSSAPCVFPDPGTASPAGSPAFMGQDWALSGHEVPGGEAVQFLGKPAQHLLIRSASSPRCWHWSDQWKILQLHGGVCFLFSNRAVVSAEGSMRRRKSRPQASLTATHSSTLAEEIVAVLRTLHSLSQWNGLINDYINSQLSSIGDIMTGCQSEAVRFTALSWFQLMC